MTGTSVGKSGFEYLDPDFAIRKLYEKVVPNLKMMGETGPVAGPFEEKRSNFAFIASDTTTKKNQKAALHIVGADLPRIDISAPVLTTALTGSKGFEISVPRAVVRDGVGGDSAIEEYFTTAGYLLPQQIEADMKATIVAQASVASPVNTIQWNADGATPVTDLKNHQKNFESSKTPYTMTDAMLGIDLFYELTDYLNFFDGGQFVGDRPTGKMVSNDTVYINMLDLYVHKIKSGLDSDAIIGYDRRYKGAALHTYSDPAFSLGSGSVDYVTIENGEQIVKKTPNMGLHYYEYMEDKTKNTIMQFWYENKTVVTKPDAFVYSTGR